MVRFESLGLIRQINIEILFCVKNLGSYINVSVLQLAVPTTLWNTAVSVIHGDSWWTYYSYLLIRSVYHNIFNHAVDKSHHVPTNVTKQTHCAADYLCKGRLFYLSSVMLVAKGFNVPMLFRALGTQITTDEGLHYNNITFGQHTHPFYFIHSIALRGNCIFTLWIVG